MASRSERETFRQWLFNQTSENYRRLFLDDQGKLHAPGAAVLADLRRASGKLRNPLVINPRSGSTDVEATMARLGMVSLFDRVVGFIGLDEAAILEIAKHERTIAAARAAAAAGAAGAAAGEPE